MHVAGSSASKNCPSSIPTTSVSGRTRSKRSADDRTVSDGIFMSLCETISSWLHRVSIVGLKICTSCRAICARRRRRISSSLLPLNMLPAMTSIQPGLVLRCWSIGPTRATGIRPFRC
jgi:hypothetical protein